MDFNLNKLKAQSITNRFRRFTAAELSDELIRDGQFSQSERHSLTKRLVNIRTRKLKTNRSAFTLSEWESGTPSTASRFLPRTKRQIMSLALSGVFIALTAVSLPPLIGISEEYRTSGAKKTEALIEDQIQDFGVLNAESVDPRTLYEAQQLYNQRGQYTLALKIGEDLSKKHKKESVFLAHVLFQLGVTHANLAQSHRSADYFSEALQMLDRFDSSNPLKNHIKINIARNQIRTGLKPNLMYSKEFLSEIEGTELEAYYYEVLAIHEFLGHNYHEYITLQSQALSIYRESGDLTGQLSCTLGLAIGHLLTSNKQQGYMYLAEVDTLLAATGDFEGWLNLYTLAKWLANRNNTPLMLRLQNLPKYDDAGILFRSILFYED